MKTAKQYESKYHALGVHLLGVFKTHIGFDNAIKRKDLFRTAFNHRFDEKDLEDYLLQHFLLRTLSYMRRRSKCFIVSRQTNAGYVYYVLKSSEELAHYVTLAKARMQGIRTAEQRAQQAFTEKWYAQKWVIVDDN